MKKMHTCHKCGAERNSFEELLAHLCGCNVLPKATKSTESPSVAEAEEG